MKGIEKSLVYITDHAKERFYERTSMHDFDECFARAIQITNAEQKRLLQCSKSNPTTFYDELSGAIFVCDEDKNRITTGGYACVTVLKRNTYKAKTKLKLKRIRR